MTESSDGRELSAITENNKTVLVTGGTSLLGSMVIAELLERGCRVVALVRATSSFTLESIPVALPGAEALPWDRVTLVEGDVWEPDLGLERGISSLPEGITHIVHLARPRFREEPLLGALVKGVDVVSEVARRLGCIERLLISSTTQVMGDFNGRFYEDWLDIGQRLPSQRAREALEAELRAREASAYIPVSVVRHAMLVGHTQTGQTSCDAGFGTLLGWALAASRLPSFARPPVPGEGPRFLHVSPVDFVSRGIVEITFSDVVGKHETFCLADTSPTPLGELFELLLDRAGAPRPGIRLPLGGRGFIGRWVESIARAGATLTETTGKGPGPWHHLLQRGEHDVTNAIRVLGPSGIECPRLETYIDALFEDYRRRHERFRN